MPPIIYPSRRDDGRRKLASLSVLLTRLTKRDNRRRHLRLPRGSRCTRRVCRPLNTALYAARSGADDRQRNVQRHKKPSERESYLQDSQTTQ